MPSKLSIINNEPLRLVNGTLSISTLLEAAAAVNAKLESAIIEARGVRLDLYQIIDLRMLSGLIGEMFSAEVSKREPRLFKNPNIDGYPDLCDVSRAGRIQELSKMIPANFLAYVDGGFEVKNTFGVKKANTHIAPRATRLQKIQRTLVWKAHHRETNNLLAIQSDYINQFPQIIAGFFSDKLTEDDWTVKQQPKEGSTMTSFCQTTPAAFKKLRLGLTFSMKEIGHERFLSQ